MYENIFTGWRDRWNLVCESINVWEVKCCFFLNTIFGSFSKSELFWCSNFKKSCFSTRAAVESSLRQTCPLQPFWTCAHGKRCPSRPISWIYPPQKVILAKIKEFLGICEPKCFMSSWVVNPTNIIQSPIIHNTSILFVMWAFNFGMDTGRSCWTNDVSDWSFKRIPSIDYIRPPGLSGGSGDGQRTNRSSQAKNMPWTWQTEMVVKGETYWNILEYLKDTTKWAPASCK